jgi:hypothetical protein
MQDTPVPKVAVQRATAPSAPTFMNLAIRVSPFSGGIPVLGTIQDFTPGEVSMLLDKCVPVGSPVTVKFKGALFEGEVLFCNPKEGHFQTNVRFRDSGESGLRRAPRFTVKLSAYAFSPNSGNSLPVTITDISGNGLGLDVPMPLAVGGPIIVESEMNIAFGIVRYCGDRSESIFHAGVELHHVSEKTKDVTGSNGMPGPFAKIMSFIGLDKASRNKRAVKSALVGSMRSI